MTLRIVKRNKITIEKEGCGYGGRGEKWMNEEATRRTEGVPGPIFHLWFCVRGKSTMAR